MGEGVHLRSGFEAVFFRRHGFGSGNHSFVEARQLLFDERAYGIGDRRRAGLRAVSGGQRLGFIFLSLARGYRGQSNKEQ